MRLPIMLRKTFDNEIARLRKYCREEMRKMERCHEIDLEFQKKDLEDVVSRLTEIAIVQDIDQGQALWRVVFVFSPEMMTKALERGGDDRTIEHIGECVKHDVMKKLTNFNIQRPETLRMGRG